MYIGDEQCENNNKLLDHVCDVMNLRNDAHLARVMDVNAPVVSKMRHGTLAIGPTMLIRFHERAGVPFPVMRYYVPEQARAEGRANAS